MAKAANTKEKRERQNSPFTKPVFSCRMGGKRIGREGIPISEFVVHLPEAEENVVLSGSAAERLIRCGSADAALLYIALLKNRGDGGQAQAQLHWDQARFRPALDVLAREKLVSPTPGVLPPPEEERRAEYTRADLLRSLENEEFSGLTQAVEGRLGKKLSTPDLMILLGLYDQVGLPADVIYLLVNFCAEREAHRLGEGRRPTLRKIEREGYLWARLGLMTQESAAAYIKKYQRSQEAIPRLMHLLNLGDRLPSPTESDYLTAWGEMGFEDEAILRAYDRTVVKCGSLKWAYMNRILLSWNEKGLHTVAQIETGDRPPRQRSTPQESGSAVREDMARMARYYQQLKKEGS